MQELLEVINDLWPMLKADGNTRKSIARLSSSTADWLSAHLEESAKAKRVKVKEKAETIRSDKQLAQLAQHLNVPLDYVLQALNKCDEKSVRGQINVDKTVIASLKVLYETSKAQDGKGGTNDAISDDFLNRFDEIVRHKSSEEMQHYFGLILAGEIRKPGTFSIRTLTILSEIDQYAAALFKTLCSLSLAIKADNGKIHDVKVCSLNGKAANNSLGKYSLGFDQLNILHEYGLIVSDYDCRFPYITSNGSSIPFEYQGQTLILQPSSEKMKGKEYRVSGVTLTLAGRELYTIVKQRPVEVYTQELKDFFEEQGLQLRIV